MKEYSTKDISNIVGIATPTVRKYAQALEKEGYVFTRRGPTNKTRKTYAKQIST